MSTLALSLDRRNLLANKRKKRKESLVFFLLISPWAIGYLLFTVVPMFSSLIYSFQRVSILDLQESPNWIGLNNYIAIFKDNLFISSIGNTFYYAIAKTFITLFFSLLLALFINSAFYGNKFARILIYLPAIIPTVASILIWSQLFSKDFSLLNYFLSFFGIPAIDWTSYSNAMQSAIFMGVWTSLGPQMLICMASLQAVSNELIDAAKIDGAGAFRRFLHVTFPSISPTLFFLSLTGIIGGLQSYAEMQLLFGTGHEHIMTMAWNVVLNAFSLNGSKTMGYACAQAWLLFFIIIVFTAIYFFFNRKRMRFED